MPKRNICRSSPAGLHWMQGDGSPRAWEPLSKIGDHGMNDPKPESEINPPNAPDSAKREEPARKLIAVGLRAFIVMAARRTLAFLGTGAEWHSRPYPKNL